MESTWRLCLLRFDLLDPASTDGHQHHAAEKQRVLMAALHRERVEHALNELIVRIVPEDADEDEEVANQRLEDAFDFAIGELASAGDPSLVPDINHIASLIDTRGIFYCLCYLKHK